MPNEIKHSIISDIFHLNLGKSLDFEKQSSRKILCKKTYLKAFTSRRSKKSIGPLGERPTFGVRERKSHTDKRNLRKTFFFFFFSDIGKNNGKKQVKFLHFSGVFILDNQLIFTQSLDQWFSTGVPPVITFIGLQTYFSIQGCRQILILLTKGAASQKRLRNTDLKNI